MVLFGKPLNLETREPQIQLLNFMVKIQINNSIYITFRVLEMFLAQKLIF